MISKPKLSQRPIVVFLSVFLILGILLAILAVLEGKGSLTSIGTFFLFGGGIVAILVFAVLTKGTTRGSISPKSPYLKNPENFKKIQTEEKPLVRILWSVILAALSIALIGYLLNYSF
jgi:hypothetical protein